MNGAACFNVDYLKTRTGTAQDAEAAQGEYLQVMGTRFACLTGLGLLHSSPFTDPARSFKRLRTRASLHFFTACLVIAQFIEFALKHLMVLLAVERSSVCF